MIMGGTQQQRAEANKQMESWSEDYERWRDRQAEKLLKNGTKIHYARQEPTQRVKNKLD